jgi:hypothetical protein
MSKTGGIVLLCRTDCNKGRANKYSSVNIEVSSAFCFAWLAYASRIAKIYFV